MNAFFIPLAALAVTAPMALLAEQGSFVSDGVPLRFIDEGTGEAVIMLHSFAGSAEMWRRVGLMPLEGLRAIAFDARGHGMSGKPESAAAYGAEMVDDVIRLMDARGVTKAHIVGYSMGAETALKLATSHPERVLSLVVAGSGWSGAPEAETYGFVSGALTGVASFGDFMAAMSDGEASDEQQSMMLDRLTAHGITPDQPAAPLAAVSGAMAELIGLSEGDLGAITVPVLGLAGEADPERGNVEALAEVLPDFRYRTIAGADHLAAPLSPDFTAAVTAFLRQ